MAPGDDPDWEGPWPGEVQWSPAASEPGVPDVDWSPPECIGELEFPDGTVHYVYEERVVGFARWFVDRPSGEG